MKTLLAVSLFFSSHILWAQTLGGGLWSPQNSNAEFTRKLQADAFEKWALDPTADKKALTAKQAAATVEFYGKAKHFVELWQQLAAEMNDRRTFNAKLAQKVSKAFHEMEKSDGWPVGHNK